MCFRISSLSLYPCSILLKGPHWLGGKMASFSSTRTLSALQLCIFDVPNSCCRGANSSLTVRSCSAGSRSGKGWEEFIDAVVKIIDKYGGSYLWIIWLVAHDTSLTELNFSFARREPFEGWWDWARCCLSCLGRVGRQASSKTEQDETSDSHKCGWYHSALFHMHISDFCCFVLPPRSGCL